MNHKEIVVRHKLLAKNEKSQKTALRIETYKFFYANVYIYSRVVLKNKETILSLEFRNSKAYVVSTRVQNILFLNFT